MKKNPIVFNSFVDFNHFFLPKNFYCKREDECFYIGLDNPVSIAAEEFTTSDLMVNTTNGKLIKGIYGYVFRQDSLGKSEIILSSRSGGKLKEIGRSAFRSKNLPLPVFHIGSTNVIKNKAELMAQEYVRAELENFDIDINYDIDSFKICIFSNDTCKYSIAENFGNRLHPDIRTQFQALKSLDVVVFKDIYVRQPNGISLLLEPLIITITN